jgi:NADPH2:quinone reductase
VKALVCNAYGSPETLCVEQIDDPGAQANQVIVDIRAAGINFPDVLQIAGQYQVRIPPPFVPGNEAAGIVSAIGDGVSHIAVGDNVIVITPSGGAFAEKCAVDANAVIPLPEQLDFEQGAGFTVTYGTSYHALKQRAELKTGETVLVLGAAGGVGITAVEIAKAMGARVIAAASSDEKLEFARLGGADELVNYGKVSLKDTVKELTDGKGIDVVYDPVGGELAQQALRATGRRGRYLVIGFASGEIPKFPANIVLLKEASIIGVWWGPWATRNPRKNMNNMQAVLQLISAEKLRLPANESYAMDDYVDAFRSITERRAKGKVILRMR